MGDWNMGKGAAVATVAVVVGVGAVTLYLLGGKDVANGLIMMGTALAAALGARITREK
jgi:hypothetical protein